MKKYFRPELTISSFEAEDIMVTSGVYSDAAPSIDGITFAQTNGDAANLASGAVFSWN